MRRTVAAVIAAAVGLAGAAPAAAEPAPRHVRYTVTADHPTSADIYYREVDPPSWADYSHNPYQFSPKAEVSVGPDTPWVLDVYLVDPERWAMVTATNGRGPEAPQFRCELAVDGVVIRSNQGPKGALCSLRNW
jgi:hypothetical protein